MIVFAAITVAISYKVKMGMMFCMEGVAMTCYMQVRAPIAYMAGMGTTFWSVATGMMH